MKTPTLPPMTEAQFQSKVVELARLYGYDLIYHTWNSRNSAKGFPDLCLCRPGDSRLLFLELKTETGKVAAVQLDWIAALDAVPNVIARVVRPSDWDFVEKTIRGTR